MKVQCRSCKASIEVSGEESGERFSCPLCGSVVSPSAGAADEKPASCRQEDAAETLKSYREGMRGMGTGLCAFGGILGGMNLLATVLLWGRFPVVGAAIVTAFCAGAVVCGLLARRLHGWVNYVVAPVSAFYCVAAVVRLGDSRTPLPAMRASEIAVGISLVLIMAAFLLVSAKNATKLKRIRKAGLDPRRTGNPENTQGGPD